MILIKNAMKDHILNIENQNRNKMYFYRVNDGTWNLYERSAFYWYSLVEGVQVFIQYHDDYPVATVAVDDWNKVEKIILGLKEGCVEKVGDDIIVEIGEKYRGFPYWKEQIILLQRCSQRLHEEYQEMTH